MPTCRCNPSGAVHAAESLLGHPVAGASWEGFAIETLLRAALGDLNPDRAFLVHGGGDSDDRYPKGGRVKAIGLRSLAEELAR